MPALGGVTGGVEGAGTAVVSGVVAAEVLGVDVVDVDVVGVVVVGVVVVGVDDVWRSATPAEIPPAMILAIAAATVDGNAEAPPTDRLPSPPTTAAETDAGKAAVPVGKSI